MPKPCSDAADEEDPDLVDQLPLILHVARLLGLLLAFLFRVILASAGQGRANKLRLARPGPLPEALDSPSLSALLAQIWL